MSQRPALLRLVGNAADEIVHDSLSNQGFEPVAPLQERTIRRYVSQRQFRDIEIEVFRDPAWGSEGGRVRIQLRALVHPMQHALVGSPQSLLEPQPDTQLAQFQLGPHADDLPGSWEIHAPADVGKFARGLLAYLGDVAVPWLRNSESIESVFALLTELKQDEQRTRFEAALRRDGHIA